MGVAFRPFKVSPRSRTPVVALVCVACLLLLGFGAFERSESRLRYALPLGLEAALPEKLRVSPPCRPGLDYLRRAEYDFTKEIIYQKRCIRGVRHAETSRDMVVNYTAPLFETGGGKVLDSKLSCNGSQSAHPPCDPITVQVPLPFPKRDYAEFVFGVASSSERLKSSIPQLKHWLGDTQARLVAIVTDDGNFSDRKMRKLTSQFNQSGIHFIGRRPQDPSIGVNEQHFIVLGDLLRLADARTKWAVIIDDDTFFPSLFPVAEAFDRQDASIPAYMGGLSENRGAVEAIGHMAFGGSGIFLSIPMLRLLEPHVGACLEESPTREGDGMLKYCIDTKTSTNFTKIPGLHQLDMGGDLSGFYESGQWPLSLHHWKTWHRAPVDKMAKITPFCGGCLFQRWRFGTNVVLTNGYSIVEYDRGIASTLDLSRMESTFTESGSGDDWEWSLGPMRDRLAASQKKSYLLLDAEVVGDSLRQVYVHRAERPEQPEHEQPGHAGNGQGRTKARDEVFELWWEWDRPSASHSHLTSGQPDGVFKSR